MTDVKLLGLGDLSWNDTNSNNYFMLFKFTASATGTLKSIRLVEQDSECTAKVAIYADSSGSPGALLAANNSDNACTANAWTTISISDVSIVNGTVYWLAFNVNKPNGVKRIAGSTPRRYKSATYSTFTFPDPAGTGFYTGTFDPALAGWGTVASTASVGRIGPGLCGSEVLSGSTLVS